MLALLTFRARQSFVAGEALCNFECLAWPLRSSFQSLSQSGHPRISLDITKCPLGDKSSMSRKPQFLIFDDYGLTSYVIQNTFFSLFFKQLNIYFVLAFLSLWHQGQRIHLLLS